MLSQTQFQGPSFVVRYYFNIFSHNFSSYLLFDICKLLLVEHNRARKFIEESSTLLEYAT